MSQLVACLGEATLDDEKGNWFVDERLWDGTLPNGFDLSSVQFIVNVLCQLFEQMVREFLQFEVNILHLIAMRCESSKERNINE